MKNQSTELSDIDIVLPWVDGSDPEWLASKRLYSGHSEGDDRDIRYRDWGLLKYVFRGIEKNLPWVRKVHFITCGHKPEWLNTDCPKLHFVKHEDYIPDQWLPTFSSHTIELNIHRIEGLSERFIYMNDDTFFMQPMKQEEFFVGNKPKSQAGFEVFHNVDLDFLGILQADLELINRAFFSREVFFRKLRYFINRKYGVKENMKTMLLAPWCFGYFPGFSFVHGPVPYLKQTFEDVWEQHYNRLSETCANKFRTFHDINQYVFMWWQWCSGCFIPDGVQKKLLYLSVEKSSDILESAIANMSFPMLCINDGKTDSFEEKKNTLIRAFESNFSTKSRFEL